MDVLLQLKNDNYFDLTSFTEALYNLKFISNDMIEDIIDFVVFDCGINCDADLSKVSESKRGRIFDEINKII